MKQDNIPGFPGYYISKRGRLFSRIQFAYDTGNKGCRRVYTHQKIYLIGIITMKKVSPYQKYVINLMYPTKQ